MIEFIKSLFNKWACSHDWQEVHITKVSDTSFGLKQYDLSTYCCSKCGKFKKVKHI